jgi:hypothetical protein
MDVPLTPHLVWPFLMAVAAAAGFGFIGFRSRRNWLAWAVGGGALGLMIATFASGLANAVSVPYTPRVTSNHQLLAAGVTVVLLGVTGFVLSRDSS